MTLEDFQIERWDYAKVLISHWAEVEKSLRGSIVLFTILFLFAELLSAGSVSGIQFLGVDIKDVGFLHRIVTFLLAVVSYQASYWLLRSVYAAEAWKAVRHYYVVRLDEIKDQEKPPYLRLPDLDDIAPNSAITRFAIRTGPELRLLFLGAQFALLLLPAIFAAGVFRAVFLLFSQYGLKDPWNWVVVIPTIILVLCSTVDSYAQFRKVM